MTVYVVTQTDTDDGDDRIVAVFSTEAAAEAFCAKEATKSAWFWYGYRVCLVDRDEKDWP